MTTLSGNPVTATLERPISVTTFQWTAVRERVFLTDMLMLPLEVAQSATPGRADVTKPKFKHISNFVGYRLYHRSSALRKLWRTLKAERNQYAHRQPRDICPSAQLTWDGDVYIMILLDRVVQLMSLQQAETIDDTHQLAWDGSRLPFLFGRRDIHDRANQPSLITFPDETEYPDTASIANHFRQRQARFAQESLAWRTYHRGDDRDGDRADTSEYQKLRALGAAMQLRKQRLLATHMEEYLYLRRPPSESDSELEDLGFESDHEDEASE